MEKTIQITTIVVMAIALVLMCYDIYKMIRTKGVSDLSNEDTHLKRLKTIISLCLIIALINFFVGDFYGVIIWSCNSIIWSIILYINKETYDIFRTRKELEEIEKEL